MAKYLVIVESPAKVKTIKKFLGSNYEVMASNGHVRDLPKSQLGVDIEHDYEPKYITIRGKGDILAALRKAAKKADKVYLATDPDREISVFYELIKVCNYILFFIKLIHKGTVIKSKGPVVRTINTSHGKLSLIIHGRNIFIDI